MASSPSATITICHISYVASIILPGERFPTPIVDIFDFAKTGGALNYARISAPASANDNAFLDILTHPFLCHSHDVSSD